MKNYLMVILFVLLSLTVIAQAQGPTPEAGAQAATAEPTFAGGDDTEHSGVVEKEEDTGTGVSESTLTILILGLGNVIAYGIILAQALLSHRSVSKESLKGFFDGLKGLAKVIPGDVDDKLVAGAEGLANAILPVAAPATATVEKTTYTVQELTGHATG